MRSKKITIMNSMKKQLLWIQLKKQQQSNKQKTTKQHNM